MKAFSISSFITTASNSFFAISSLLAIAKRSLIASSVSVPLPLIRFSSSDKFGGAKNICNALGKDFRICRAPSNSISRRTLVPPSIFSLTIFFGVP